MSDQAPHVKMLLASAKVNISTQDNEGRAPLNYAVLTTSPSCIRVSKLVHCTTFVVTVDVVVDRQY